MSDISVRYPEYWHIQTKGSHGWSNFNDDNFILSKSEEEAINYAKKISGLYKVRVVHETSKVVWVS